MFAQFLHIIKIFFIWKIFCISNKIRNDYIVLVLADENKLIDDIAVNRFPELIKKRFAKKGIIITFNKQHITNNSDIQTIYLSKSRIKSLYELFCFYKFSDNIIFTYVNTPKDNYLARYIEKSGLDENDIVCLSLFRLGKT